MTSLADLQNLYDRNRFVEAFRQSSQYWKPSVRVDDLSSDQIAFGGRLAFRLGGFRLSRWLFRAALNRNPSDPRVRYFARGIRQHRWSLVDELRAWEADAELPGADSDTQANFFASQGVTWASLRDFARAHSCIERARSFHINEGWVFSCQSDVLGLEDRWDDALKSAERSWELSPGTPFAASGLSRSLLNLRRIREAANRLATAAEGGQSFEIAHLASWHLCTLAETVEGDERRDILQRARDLANQFPALAPLADREARRMFARIWLDIAELEDDHAAMERWAKEIRSPFHRTALANLRKNPNGRRIRLPFRRAIQKYQACLPTSVASSLAAMNIDIDPDAMASDITFGGTAEWAAARWLEKRGLEVRFFVVAPEVAVRLVKNGIAFVMTLEADANAHAVAVVGLDEAAGTLIIHDPQALRTTEYLLASIGNGENPLGPHGIAIVPGEKAALLDQLLPRADVDAMTAAQSYREALALRGAAAAREIIARLEDQQPGHPVTRLLKATQGIEEGRVGLALVEFQALMRLFPASAMVRANLLRCCRSLGDTALMRTTLAGVVERGSLPAIQSQQNWLYPPSAYVGEYAELLRESAETRDRARSLLHEVIRRENTSAQAWHILADLLWEERDLQGALLAYRISACLADNNEHYARAYCDALANVGRKEDGLKWLENRVRSFGDSSPAIATWITWINALEDWGHPEGALAACEASLQNHISSSELLAFVVPFLTRMGRWQEADTLLRRLEALGNPARFHEAASDFHRRRGELEQAIEHAEVWVTHLPLWMTARHALLYLVAKRDGIQAALERAFRWVTENPGHDDLEQLYCDYLGRASSPRGKQYSLLLLRLKRNREDGWAWRELAFACIAEYQGKEDHQRERLKRRIPALIAECDRTAPQDPATLRARAQWSEAREEWDQAIDHWLEAINREPNNSYGYRQVWDCLARSSSEQRSQCWQKIFTKLVTYPGRLSVARDVIILAARRFGIAEAELIVSTWQQARPDDPEITEAHVDLLLQHGQGRTDAARALELLRPAVERYPFHLGLRFSLVDALRKLGEFKEAEQVLGEIIRRHPDNSAAQIQLARVQEHVDVDAALRILASAASRDPQNADIRDVHAQILIAAGRLKEARATIHDGLLQFPKNVHWRERAIKLLVDCGDNEAAVRVAREGVRVYPRGAYLWLLLGRTLEAMSQFAVTGEVESCLRSSLALNRSLFDAADWLATLLVKQHRYAEAEELMLQIQRRLSDPSPALGRLAWIHRAKGDKSAARQEMASVVSVTPWFIWGWNVLMEWLAEDQAWDQTRNLLSSVPPEVRTDIQFRRRRLFLLEKASLPAADLESEWNSLLLDFPEDLPLRLIRYDSLRNSKRNSEAAAVLNRNRTTDSESPFFLARLVEVLAVDEKKNDQALESLMRIFFSETEESIWPADYAWKAIKSARLEEPAYKKTCALLRQGSRPTLRALSILASFAFDRANIEKRRLQPFWRTWFPDCGGRELLALLKILDSAPWSTEQYRGIPLRELCDAGYSRLVVRYWKKHRVEVEAGVGSWAQTGRALINLNRKAEARRLLGNWRERPGVGMWALANYALCLSPLRSKQLREMLSTSRDALAGLPHDQCAKYLAHRQVEACALLGDTQMFQESYKAHRNYFDCRLGKEEWFEEQRRYLIGDLPAMARSLEANDLNKYRQQLRHLRWERISERLKFTTFGAARSKSRWVWIVVWLLWLLYQASRNH